MNWYVNDWPALPVAPPPVRLPENVPPAPPSGTSERSVIGMLPSSLRPVPRCRLRLSSPGWPAVTFTWNVPVCPGASVRELGETEPVEWNRSVA